MRGMNSDESQPALLAEAGAVEVGYIEPGTIWAEDSSTVGDLVRHLVFPDSAR